MLDAIPTPILLVAFAVAAVAVWLAGIKLSDTTDVLSTRLGLGEALGGLILLAVATNLPELAITASAALGGNLGIAIGNILGGIAIQTVVLVILDVVGVGRSAPLTYRAASLVLVLEGVLVIAVLIVAIMGSQLPASLIAARIAPDGLLIAVLWVVGVWLVSRRAVACPGTMSMATHLIANPSHLAWHGERKPRLRDSPGSAPFARLRFSARQLLSRSSLVWHSRRAGPSLPAGSG